jgi:hypothetical protein
VLPIRVLILPSRARLANTVAMRRGSSINVLLCHRLKHSTPKIQGSTRCKPSIYMRDIEQIVSALNHLQNDIPQAPPSHPPMQSPEKEKVHISGKFYDF